MNYNDNAVKTRSNSGRYMVRDNGYFETDISTLFVDAMFKYNGWSVMGDTRIEPLITLWPCIRMAVRLEMS